MPKPNSNSFHHKDKGTTTKRHGGGGHRHDRNQQQQQQQQYHSSGYLTHLPQTQRRLHMPVQHHQVNPYGPYRPAPAPSPTAQYMHNPIYIYPQTPYPSSAVHGPFPGSVPLALYDSAAFTYSQSSIFATYLQSMHHHNSYSSNYTHTRSPHNNNTGRSGSDVSATLPLSVPRGPPKKPKQSGFAIWVGNLPLNTTLIELTSLFGTAEIQSVFLIQRTLCAFVNYASQRALEDGITTFEQRGSSIRGNQLVIKIKTAGSKNNEEADEDDDTLDSTDAASPVLPKDRTPTEDRYFVCKSLTVEDLYASARLGLWDTQSHNQATFNEAFKVFIFHFFFFLIFFLKC